MGEWHSWAGNQAFMTPNLVALLGVLILSLGQALVGEVDSKAFQEHHQGQRLREGRKRWLRLCPGVDITRHSWGPP